MARMHPTFRKWLLVFLGFLILAVAGAGVALGSLLGYLSDLPPLTVLDNYSPPEVSKVYDRTGNNQLAEFFDERREVVRIENIPDHVLNAFIAIEDERFADHFGVDLWGIGRAVFANLKSGERMQGASTITMQVARNIVLQDKKKVWSRKLREIMLSLQIERNYSKKQILEFYVNEIFLGNKAYGIQAAARAYFGKDVKDLSVSEAALIAGLPKSPSRLDPTRFPERALARRNLVLGSMRKAGYIASDDDLKRLQAEPLGLNPAQRSSKWVAPYFVDYVRAKLLKDNSMQQSSELGTKAFTIISTVDLNLQKICEEELAKGLRDVEKKIEEQKPDRFGVEASELGSVRKKQARLARIKEVRANSIIVTLQGYTAEVKLPEKLPYFNPQAVVKVGNLIDIVINDIKGGKMEASLYDNAHVQGSAVLLDARTGEIMALVGGEDFDDMVNAGQYNRAYQGGRQPGSCWKPLLYSSAMDVDGPDAKPRFTPGYVVIDDALTFPDGWTPKNYENRHYGPTTLYEGLVKSRNIPTIKLFMEIGPKKAVPLYEKFKLVDRDNPWKLDAVPSMPLGTPSITPLELASAYATIANGGLGTVPTPLKRLYTPKSPGDSRVVRPEQYRVLTPQAAYIAEHIMMDVVKMGTAKSTVGKWIGEQTSKGRKIPEIAGKTGTTNNCFVAWFCGYTPDLVLAIYVGYDQHRTMGPKMVGGGTVGPIWVPMMDRILKTRTDWKMKFDVPSGIVFRDLCGVSGKIASADCYASGVDVFNNAPFKEGSEPKGTCDGHGGGGGGESGDAESGYQVGNESSQGERGDPQPQGYNWWQ